MDLSSIINIWRYIGAVVLVIVRWLHFTITFPSLPITTKVASSNPVHGEVYSNQPYVIKFVSDLRQVGGFLRVLRFPPTKIWPSRYNFIIVESGVNLHKPKPIMV